MKPINAQELNRSYLVFFINFAALVAFSIFCLYLFIAAQNYEYSLLKDDAIRAEKLLLKRKEVNTQFDIILSRFNELSKFTFINAREMDNQASMLEDIQNANLKLKDLINHEQATSSFLLYKKMTDDVNQMAGIQDSLFITRFKLESYKLQLGSCLKLNHSAENKLSFGSFRR
jgi:hypothetical protein